MNNNSLWQDDYRLLLMQLYQRKPVGMKPIYSRPMVSLAMELHLPPAFLYERMFELRNAATPSLRRLWKKYGDNPRRLSRDAETVRRMTGFFNQAAFYEGVDVAETFEKDFRPIPRAADLMPVMLILILDLYFRLTPITMVASTPEVQELARMMKIPAARVVEVMEAYRIVDPYLNRTEQFMVSPLLAPCGRIWNRYGNGSIESLATVAAQMREYFSAR